MGLHDVDEAVAVVQAVADLEVVQAIHVGAHLRGRRDLLHDPVDVVSTEPVTAGAGPAEVRLVRGGGEVLAEAPPGEGGDLLVEHVAQVVDAPAPHQRRGRGHRGRRDLVQRAGLVVRSVAGLPPRVVHGHLPRRGGGLPTAVPHLSGARR